MNKSKIKINLAIIFLITIASVPHIAHNTLNQSSLAAGLIFVAILLIPLFSNEKTINIKFNSKIPKIIFSVIIYELLVALIRHTNDKSMISASAAAIFIIFSWLISTKYQGLDENYIISILTRTTFILLTIAMISYILPYKIPGYQGEKAIFPFSEISHLALFIGPLLFCIHLNSQNKILRILSLATILTIGLGLKSTTMLAYLPLTILANNKSRKRHYLILIPLITIIAYTIMSNNYFYERLKINEESNNLSALIYLQGIEDTITALEESKLLGVGFQMMGTQSESDISRKISLILNNTATEINRQDGSFLAAKIISEFGIVGIFLILLSLRLTIRAIVELRHKRYNHELKVNICNAYLCAFNVEIFVRGFGYFSPQFLIYLSCVFYLSNHLSKRAINRKKELNLANAQITLHQNESTPH